MMKREVASTQNLITGFIDKSFSFTSVAFPYEEKWSLPEPIKSIDFNGTKEA